ncbi:MAG: hypothetical protein ACYS3N_15805 [Planctomycetota bacterium]|jgi:hypothetical protein
MSQEDYYNSILNSIFHSQDPDQQRRNPNDPADNAYFNAQAKIRIQAYANWVRSGGEQLLQHMEEELIDLIKAFVGTPITDKSMYLQQKIWDKIDMIDTIHKAFVEQGEQNGWIVGRNIEMEY